MPNIWTHLIFGRELLNKLGKAELIELRADGNIFNLGCQGPDFLFYHNFQPWKTEKRMNELGSKIHLEHCGDYLLQIAKYTRQKLHLADRTSTGVSANVAAVPADAKQLLNTPLVLYTLGFLTHHVLDRNMHPYIYFKSGFKKWHHQRFEIIMDTLIAKKLRNIDTWNTPVWEQIDVGRQLPDAIAVMFAKVTRQVFPDLAADIKPAQWSQAYTDMVSAQKLFHDPFGLKRILSVNLIGPLVYKKKNAPLDYLNEAKQMWNHPVSQSEVHHTSVWDLWEQAMADGEAVLTAAMRFLTVQNGPATDEFAALANVLGDISYDTGKPCSSGLQNKYVNPII